MATHSSILAWISLPLTPPGKPIYEQLIVLKDDAVEVLYSVCQQVWKTQQWPQAWKRSGFIPIPKKGNAKEYSNYISIALISHASKIRLKIFQQHVDRGLPNVQAGFRKGRGTRNQIPTFTGTQRKQRNSRKISASLTVLKPLIVQITTNYSFHNKLWKILLKMGTSVVSDCNPMDYSPPGSIVHGILQARTLGWVVIPFSRNVTNRRW